VFGHGLLDIPDLDNIRKSVVGIDCGSHVCVFRLCCVASMDTCHADCILPGIPTPLMIIHSASVTSNTSIGNHTSSVIGPPRNPASCKGRTTTSRTDATTPSDASANGTIAPRRSNQEKSVLPTAKKDAAMIGFQLWILKRNAPIACAVA